VLGDYGCLRIRRLRLRPASFFLDDAQTVVGTDRADPEQRLSDVCAGGETGISVMATYLMVTLAFLCGGTLGNTPAIA
jgi:hypothetical protein